MFSSNRKLVLIVLGVALVFRFVPWNYPNEVIYDEVHFGKHALAYCCTHENYFDVHPPLGKLILSLPLVASSYSGQQDFSAIGIPYQDFPSSLFRFLPKLLGALVPTLLTILLLLLGVTPLTALIAGLAVALDNGFIIQSRFALLDMSLLFFLLASLVFFESSKKLTGIYRWLFIVGSGVLAGMSLSVKFSGAVALAMSLVGAGLSFYSSQDRRRFSSPLQHLTSVSLMKVTLLASALSIYCLSWFLHFRLLFRSGRGDYFFIPSGNFWNDLMAIHPLMFLENSKLAPHNDASVWWSWAFMNKPVYYWTKDGADLYFVGNPVVWWGALILLLWLIGKAVRQPLSALSFKNFPWYGCLGLMGSLLPFAFVSRPFFSYNWLMPLLFLLIWLAQWMERGRPAKPIKHVGLVVLTLVAGTLSVLPVTYGFEAPDLWQKWIVRLFS